MGDYPVVAINKETFGYSFSSVTIPATVKEIGPLAFESFIEKFICKGETPATLGTNAFYDDNRSTPKTYVPQSAVDTYKTAWTAYASYIQQDPAGTIFTYNESQYRINDDYETVTLVKAGGWSSELDLEASVHDYDYSWYRVSAIAENAFAGNTTITHVHLPYFLTSIGDKAFANSNVSEIFVDNNNPAEIGKDVFSGISDLKIYVYESKLTDYQNKWKDYTQYITKNPIGETFTVGDYEYTIANFEWNNCYVDISKYNGQETDVIVPSSVSYEGKTYAVINLGHGGCVFQDSNIETITIPNNIANILGYGVFYNLYNLKSVFFLNVVPPKFYSNEAFIDCGKYSLYVPQGTVDAYKESNSNYTFKEDLRGTDYQDGNFVYRFNNDFTLTLKEYKGTDETMVTIARKVKKDNVTYTVASIADKVFADKNFIKTFVVMGDTLISMDGKDVFTNHASDMVIYVLPSMTDAYKAAEGWSNYAQYIQTSPIGKSFTSGDYTYVLNEDLQSVSVSNYSGSMMGNHSIEVVIPSEFTDSESGKTYPVTAIKSNAFDYFNTERIESMVIPASVTLIEEKAISVRSIRTIQILGNATSIANNALCEFSINRPSFFLVPEDAYDHYMKSSYSYYIAVLGKSMELTDETALPSKRYLFKPRTLTYRRTVAQAGQYATLVLPFEISVSDNNGIEAAYSVKDIMIHYLNNAANNNEGVEKFILMLTKQSYFYAGYPMILKLADGNSEISFTNHYNAVLDPNALTNANRISVVDWDGTSGIMEDNTNYDIACTGTYEKKDVSQLGRTVYYTFNPDGTFGPQTSGSINPFRMYLDVYNYSTPMCYSISIGVNDGGTTGIRELVTTPVRKNSHAVYDINGRLVNTNGSTKGLSKGIYIIGNKKVIVNK